jgi:hypothetical protein
MRLMSLDLLERLVLTSIACSKQLHVIKVLILFLPTNISYSRQDRLDSHA